MPDLNRIKINTESLQDVVEQKAEKSYPTKLSQLINTSGFVTADGTVNHAQQADSADEITVTSGVTPGTYGPTEDVIISNTGTGTIFVPQFTVNNQGLVTSVMHRELSISNTCSACSHCDKTSGCSEGSRCSHGCTSNHSRSCSQCSQTP